MHRDSYRGVCMCVHVYTVSYKDRDGGQLRLHLSIMGTYHFMNTLFLQIHCFLPKRSLKLRVFDYAYY